MSEYEALHAIFKMVRKGIKDSGCSRAIMVAHNATFDHSFMMAAAERASLKRNPFHPFVTFDTAALSGLALGQTVLSKACWRQVWSLTVKRPTPLCMIPSGQRCCFVKLSIAGSARRLAVTFADGQITRLTTPLLLTMAVKATFTGRFPFHRLLCVRLLSFIFCRSFFNKLLQLATLIHFNHNITPADQLAVHPQLWECRPVGVFR